MRAFPLGAFDAHLIRQFGFDAKYARPTAGKVVCGHCGVEVGQIVRPTGETRVTVTVDHPTHTWTYTSDDLSVLGVPVIVDPGMPFNEFRIRKRQWV